MISYLMPGDQSLTLKLRLAWNLSEAPRAYARYLMGQDGLSREIASI
jgi:hypothetical protein